MRYAIMRVEWSWVESQGALIFVRSICYIRDLQIIDTTVAV